MIPSRIVQGNRDSSKAQQSAGAISAVWSPFQKLLFASYATAMYVVKLFLPLGLSAIYPITVSVADSTAPPAVVANALTLTISQVLPAAPSALVSISCTQ